MKAITINLTNVQKYKLKSIDDVYSFLDKLKIVVLVIAAERSSLGYNYHYHILTKDYEEDIERYLWSSAIFNETVLNEFSYYDYICKEGNFKIFNDYQPPYKMQSKNQYELMLNDIYTNNVPMQEIRLRYPVLFVRHYNTICKMYNINGSNEL